MPTTIDLVLSAGLILIGVLIGYVVWGAKDGPRLADDLHRRAVATYLVLDGPTRKTGAQRRRLGLACGKRNVRRGTM